MSGVCYAGKNAIFKNKHQFYLDNRHLRPTQGGCYAGKSELGKGTKLTFTCTTDTPHGIYAGKSDDVF